MTTLALMTLLVLGEDARPLPTAPVPLTTADLAFGSGAPVALPAPSTTGGKPLMAALADRRSTRDLRPDPLPLATLSDLLWAATGVNRKADGRLTAATARNWQSLEVYVVLPKATFRYEPAAHALVPVKAGDLRPLAGRQDFVATAPLNLVYVSDRTRLTEVADEADKLLYDGVHAGIVAENVYLFAASAGLGTVVRAYVDKPAFAAAAGLPDTRKVLLAQTVGLPK